MVIILDYYGILGVSPSASQKEIKDAYRKLALKHHPDKNTKDKDANCKFQYVNEAYAILSDQSLKQRHDQDRRSAGTKLYNPLSSQQSQGSEYNYEPKVDASNVFGSEFEEMLRTELGSGDGKGYVWSVVGAVSGLGLRFIIFNIPGALAGLAIGRQLGSIRDQHGRSVVEVFQSLPESERVKILTALAHKLFDGVLK
ncbi:hypothetical protein MP228_007417 [Amoeboaphelidium protococcarum]|nr:hypothetical protein MP228_007417 [Amoeboaphelidium protococcarum]